MKEPNLLSEVVTLSTTSGTYLAAFTSGKDIKNVYFNNVFLPVGGNCGNANCDLQFIFAITSFFFLFYFYWFVGTCNKMILINVPCYLVVLKIWKSFFSGVMSPNNNTVCRNQSLHLAEQATFTLLIIKNQSISKKVSKIVLMTKIRKVPIVFI